MADIFLYLFPVSAIGLGIGVAMYILRFVDKTLSEAIFHHHETETIESKLKPEPEPEMSLEERQYHLHKALVLFQDVKELQRKSNKAGTRSDRYMAQEERDYEERTSDIEENIARASRKNKPAEQAH